MAISDPLSTETETVLKKTTRRSWLSRFFIPYPIWWIDRYFLLHYPVIWRTKILYFIWFSLILANGFLFGLGHLLPLETKNVPTLQEIDQIVMVLRFVGLMVLIWWCYNQICNPLLENGIRTYLLTGVIYFVCFWFVFLNPLSLIVPVTQRIADLVPDAEFQQEIAFLENRGARIETLERYGIGLSSDSISDFEWKLFTDRLVSLREAKLSQQSKDAYYTFTNFIVPGHYYWPMINAIFAGALFMSVYPASARKRRFTVEREWPPLSMFKLSEPGFLRRFDKFLRVHHPIVWSTRVFNGLICGGILILILASLRGLLLLAADFSVLSIQLKRSADIIAEVTPFFGGVVFSFLWAYHQSKIPLRIKSLADIQKALLLYVLAIFFINTLFFCSKFIFEWELYIPNDFHISSLILVIVGCLFISEFVLLQKHIRSVQVLFLVLCFSLIGGFVTLTLPNADSTTVMGWWVLIWLVVGLIGWGISKESIAISVPVEFLLTTFVFCTVFSGFFIIQLIGDWWNIGKRSFAVFYFVMPFLFLAIIPVISLLVQCHYYPKAEK